jgi:hypothetical protein
VPEDRFGDLDPARRRARGGDRFEDLDPAERAGPDRRSAAERLAELDNRPEPSERGDGPAGPPPPRTGSRYAWVVGVAVFLVIAVAMVNTLPNSGRGREGPPPSEVLPDFAAPSASGTSDADANIRQATGGSSEEGTVPACEVRADDVVNICRLRERPVVLTFVAPGCEEALDRVEAVRADYPGVSFVGVIIGEAREDLDGILAEHEWGFPVALDPDSAVFNLYRAADCPTTITAEAGGEVVATRNGTLSEDELRAAAEEVVPPGRGDAT